MQADVSAPRAVSLLAACPPRGLLLLCLGALLGLGACAHAPVPWENPAFAAPEARPYVTALEQNTRQLAHYSQLETRLLITATLHNADYQQAWLAEYARLYKPTPEERQALEQRLKDGRQKTIELLVWTSAPSTRLARLEPKDGVWSLKLRDDAGHSLAPQKVTQVKKPTVQEQYFYPYITQLGTIWRLEFPAQAPDGVSLWQSKALTLEVSGVGGSVALTWP